MEDPHQNQNKSEKDSISRLGSRLIRRRILSFLNTFRLTEHTLLIFQAVLVGLVCGGATIAFKYIMDWHTEMFTEGGDRLLHGYGYLFPLIPAFGALVAGLLIHFGGREAKGHGVSEVMEAIATKGSRIPFRVAVIKTFASAFTIGSGGSAGREGPIVQIGSALGSALSGLTSTGVRTRRMLVACGAAAGIAGIFNAPIAGVFFAVEIILGTFTADVLAPVVVSAVASSMVVRAVLGNQPAFVVPPHQLVSWWEFSFYLILGLLGGFVSVAFKKVLILVEDVFVRVPLPTWLRPALGGLLVGLIAVSVPEILGDGLSVISQTLTGEFTLSFLLIMLVAKMIATPLTLGSGGSGGTFMPALFLGAMLGGAVGVMANEIGPDWTGEPGAYALVGMGVLVAGSTHAIITAIMLVFEITGDYALILPLMAGCILSMLISRRLHGETIYTEKLTRHGIRLFDGRDSETLRELRVAEVIDHDVDILSEDTPLFTILARFQASRHATFPVVDDDEKIVGIISFDDIRPILAEQEMGSLLLARDLEHLQFRELFPDDNFLTALSAFSDEAAEELPVLDPKTHSLIGMVSRADILKRYEREVLRRTIQVEGTV